MKKLSKRNYILVFISLIVLICFIGLNNYKKPINIHKVFNQATMTKPNSEEELKKTTVEINAKVYRGLYRGSIFNLNSHFMDKLEGQIIIDNKEYYFHAFTDKSELINILGSVYENNQSTSDIFWFKMNDLDSISLIGTGKNGYDYQVIAEDK